MPAVHRQSAGTIRSSATAASSRRSRFAPVALAVLAVLAAPGTLGAQEPTIDSPYRWVEGSFRVGGHAGYLNADRGQLRMGPGSTPAFAGRARIRLANPLSLEASLSFGNSDRFVVDPRLAGGPAVVDTVPLRWLAVEGSMQLALTGARTWHGLQPYVTIGAGLVFGLQEEQSPALGVVGDTAAAPFRFELNAAPVAAVGAGTELHLSERTSLAFEARDHLWRLTAPDGFFRDEILDRIEDAGTPAPTERDWTHNLELSVGLWYYF